MIPVVAALSIAALSIAAIYGLLIIFYMITEPKPNAEEEPSSLERALITLVKYSGTYTPETWQCRARIDLGERSVSWEKRYTRVWYRINGEDFCSIDSPLLIQACRERAASEKNERMKQEAALLLEKLSK